MNILVINWQDWKNPYAGGAEVYLYEIFSRLIRKGHTVVLLCSRARGQKRQEVIDGFQIYRIGSRANFNFFAPAALRALLRHRHVDIIIDDLNKIPFYSTVFTRKKVLPTLMHLFRSTIYRETNPLFATYVLAAERLVSKLYPHANFVAISDSTAQDLKEIGVNNHIYIVHSGIPEKMPVKQKRQEKLIAYVGRIKTYKSIDHFVRVLALLKEGTKCSAKIVGDGDALGDLVALSIKLHVDVEFLGFVSEEEKFRVYCTAQVIVQPSIKEGWGLTAIEAQSCGTPVVCADSPGLREVVLHNKTGFLYPYGDLAEMARRIQELLDDQSKWRRFSKAALEWSKQFSWSKSAEKFEKVLKHEIDHEK
jgi:glycosyltransferase involved in cell wall biosynthesis